MNRSALIAVGIALVGTDAAHSGVVTFDPPVVYALVGDGEAAIDVRVAAEPGRGFDFVDVLLQLEGFWPTSFEFSDEFIDATLFRSWSIPGAELEGCLAGNRCLFVGGLLAEPAAATSLGTFRFSFGGASGEHELFVDSSADGISGLGLGDDLEDLFGTARIVVDVPEPGVGALLLAATAGVIRRRRHRSGGSRCTS